MCIIERLNFFTIVFHITREVLLLMHFLKVSPVGYSTKEDDEWLGRKTKFCIAKYTHINKQEIKRN